MIIFHNIPDPYNMCIYSFHLFELTGARNNYLIKQLSRISFCLQIFSWHHFSSCSIGKPFTPGDDTAPPPIRVGLAMPPTVVVGLPPAVAWDLVPIERTVADETLLTGDDKSPPADL